MNRKRISIIFCIILLLTVFGNFSAGLQLNIPQNKNKSNISENIFVEVNPVGKNTYFLNTNSNPFVNITSPENGAYLPTPYLEVLGYAYSAEGLNFYEWTCYLNNTPYCHNSSTFNSSSYCTFRIRVFNLQIGTHKVVVNFSDINNHR